MFQISTSAVNFVMSNILMPRSVDPPLLAGPLRNAGNSSLETQGLLGERTESLLGHVSITNRMTIVSLEGLLINSVRTNSFESTADGRATARVKPHVHDHAGTIRKTVRLLAVSR